MISISLCGFLVVCLGLWLCSNCSLKSVVAFVVCRLCLESVYWGFINFLFLM